MSTEKDEFCSELESLEQLRSLDYNNYRSVLAENKNRAQRPAFHVNSGGLLLEEHCRDQVKAFYPKSAQKDSMEYISRYLDEHIYHDISSRPESTSLEIK